MIYYIKVKSKYGYDSWRIVGIEFSQSDALNAIAQLRQKHISNWYDSYEYAYQTDVLANFYIYNAYTSELLAVAPSQRIAYEYVNDTTNKHNYVKIVQETLDV